VSLQTYSLFQSSKIGKVEEIELARNVGSHVKACRLNFLHKLFDNHLTSTEIQDLRNFISNQALLIPIPKSAPLLTGAQWPSLEISKFLLNRNFGKEVLPYLQRIKAVPKAAFQNNSEERPSVQSHLDTIDTVNNISIPEEFSEIILVDDYITQGRVGYACFQKISSMYPNKIVKLFRLIRSNKFNEIEKCILPKSGNLSYNSHSGKTQHSFD
jgi:hypothetical protein